MEKKRINIKVIGTKPIMFDRFITMKNSEDIPVEEKFYINNGIIGIPSLNIMSFLSADLTDSATKRIMGRKWRSTARAALSFVEFEDEFIPLKRNGIELTKENSNWEVHKCVARVKKGGGLIVPSPKVRPLIKEWEMEWTMFLYETPDLKEPVLKGIFEQGGLMVGFGTYRGFFGKFNIESWTSDEV